MYLGTFKLEDSNVDWINYGVVELLHINFFEPNILYIDKEPLAAAKALNSTGYLRIRLNGDNEDEVLDLFIFKHMVKWIRELNVTERGG